MSVTKFVEDIWISWGDFSNNYLRLDQPLNYVLQHEAGVVHIICSVGGESHFRGDRRDYVAIQGIVWFSEVHDNEHVRLVDVIDVHHKLAELDRRVPIGEQSDLIGVQRTREVTFKNRDGIDQQTYSL